MIPLLKSLTQARQIGCLPEDRSPGELVIEILSFAERQGTVVWWQYDEKLIRLTGSVKNYLNEKQELIYQGDYLNFSHPYEDHFKFEYPGDKVVDGTLKSKVSPGKGVFMLMEATFEDGVSPELIGRFKKQKGTVAAGPGKHTCFHVRLEGPPLSFGKPGEMPFFTMTQEIFQALLPESKSPAGSEVPSGAYGKIKKLLRSDDPDQVTTGLNLLSSLNEPELLDKILNGVTSTTAELIPNEFFSRSNRLERNAIRNTAITGVLRIAAHLPAWKTVTERLEELDILVDDMSHLGAFKNLKKLTVTLAEKSRFHSALDLAKLETLEIEREDANSPYRETPVEFDFSLMAGCISLRTLKSSKLLSITGDFTGLAQMKELNEMRITISDLVVNDFKTLANNKKLSILELIKNLGRGQDIAVTSLDGLDQLTNLEYIHLENISFRDSAALAELNALRHLSVWHNPVLHKLTMPATGGQIQLLEIENCPQLTEILPTTYATELDLRLTKTALIGLPLLNGVRKLLNLVIKKCAQLTNLDGLKEVTVLAQNKVSLFGCEHIQNLNGIGHIRQIRELELTTKVIPSISAGNEITSLTLYSPGTLEGIQQYAALRILRVPEGAITDFSPLATLKNLKVLDLSNNKKIQSLKGVEQIEFLTILNLINLENLTDISTLNDRARLRALRCIYANGSRLKKWDFPPHLIHWVNLNSSSGFEEDLLQSIENTSEYREQFPTDPEVISILSNVTLKDRATGDLMTYTLVSEEDSDPKAGKISVQSPIGKGLLGRRKGETVNISTPGREMEIKIIDVYR